MMVSHHQGLHLTFLLPLVALPGPGAALGEAVIHADRRHGVLGSLSSSVPVMVALPTPADAVIAPLCVRYVSGGFVVLPLFPCRLPGVADGPHWLRQLWFPRSRIHLLRVPVIWAHRLLALEVVLLFHGVGPGSPDHLPRPVPVALKRRVQCHFPAVLVCHWCQ